MITKEFLQYTGFCAPIISSLGCAIMLVLFRHTHAKSEEGTLHRLLVSYFLLVSLGWICSLVYVYLPLLYVRINILYFGARWSSTSLSIHLPGCPEKNRSQESTIFFLW